MKLVGTSKIRGVYCMVLDNKRHLEVYANKPVYLSLADFNCQDVQQAIALGYVRAEQFKTGLEVPTIEGTITDGSKKIRCCNVHNRPLAMNLFPLSLESGKEFIIEEKDLHDPEMKTAIAKGYIKIVGAKINTELKESSEVKVDVSNVFMADKIKEAEKMKNTRFLHNDHNNLETNEEISTPVSVTNKTKTIYTPIIDDPNPAPVQAPDEKHNTVIWNPTGNKVISGMKKDEQIQFVDQTQEAERIKQHPKLKDKPLPVEKEISFVDQQIEKEKIQAHPILREKKSQPNDETQFVK